MELKREVIFSPAFDKRHADPSKNYGIHNAEIKFLLTGPDGAIQFVCYTGWDLPHVRREMLMKGNTGFYDYYPHGTDIGYHAKVAQWEGQTPMDGICPYIGCTCFYDGSSLNAEPIAKTLLEEGSEAVWKILEEHYADRFGAVP